jgi:hypothetical protein
MRRDYLELIKLTATVVTQITVATLRLTGLATLLGYALSKI